MTASFQQNKSRPFLKWAGGKFRLTDKINRRLPKTTCLIEPFVGAGSVFLNSQYEQYILADTNADLINLFKIVQSDIEHYIVATKELFNHPTANTAEFYYAQRELFNKTEDIFQRAVIFLYMNRFGYNGLCRYNQNNKFNVPFGSYVKPYFPENELRFFHQKSQKAEFLCQPFAETFKLAHANSVIYCDPPYAPLVQASNFTQYSSNNFGENEQEQLAKLAYEVSLQHDISVVISNHDTPFTRKIYQDARISKFKVHRSISQSSDKRQKVNELFAIYSAKKHLKR